LTPLIGKTTQLGFLELIQVTTMALLDGLAGVTNLADKHFSVNHIGSKWFSMGAMASADFEKS